MYLRSATYFPTISNSQMRGDLEVPKTVNHRLIEDHQGPRSQRPGAPPVLGKPFLLLEQHKIDPVLLFSIMNERSVLSCRT